MKDLTNLKELRKKAGLTQSALAKALGVDIKTVQNWEAGRAIPKTKYGILRNVLERESSAASATGGSIAQAGSNNKASITQSADIALLKERIELLNQQIATLHQLLDEKERLITEKERTIHILIKQNPTQTN